jgi:outer membrane protein OmpA-like peptidoglycan-associated protein
MKPTSFAELRGRVRNRSTNSPLQANLTITHLDSDSSWSTSTSITGDYRIPVPREGRYSITAQTQEHIFSSTLYAVSSACKVEPSSVDIQLFAEQGTQRLLVFYQTDKYELQKESNKELERLVRFMKETPSAVVEISGHTDSQGDDEYNQKLSERRAHAVVEYLSKRGILTSRLKATGYGETKSVSTNTTEEGRANNRRVEMTVRKK